MGKNKVCCNCRHNIRTNSLDYAMPLCYCEIDGHYIGYVACFEDWCNHYAPDAISLWAASIQNGG